MSARPQGLGYFGRAAPLTLIFGAFAVIFLPLAIMHVRPNFAGWVVPLTLVEVIGLGVTHFFITLAVYLRAENLEYFASSARNRLIYFVAPAAILLFFALSEAFDLRGNFPVFGAYFFGAIRLFDFFHVGRQSFGMLQIFKRPVAAGLPAWSRRGENAFFVGMALMQWETFLLGGRFVAGQWFFTMPAAAMGLLFVAVAMNYVHERVENRQAWTPLIYFVLQAVSAAAAVYETRLYLIALAMHYVEYHVIMAPRCLRAPLDATRRVDRAFGWLTASPWLFYGVLLVVVLTFEGRNHLPGGLEPSTAFFVHLFDGIFFVHYFIEAFLWKFNNPFYGRTLGPLYFDGGSRAPSTDAEAASAPDPRRKRPSHALVGAVVVIGLAVAGVRGSLEAAADYLDRTVVAPVHVQNHMRWGMDLVNAGDLREARAHFVEVTRRDPGNAQARQVLSAIDERLAAPPRRASDRGW